MARRFAQYAARTLVALSMLAVGAGLAPRLASAVSSYPRVHAWALVGAYQDSSLFPRGARQCIGALQPRPDSLRIQAQTVSLRFLRDRDAELRDDFGGYRIYRMVVTPDTTRAMLLRRYSVNSGSEGTWHFSRVSPGTREFVCNGEVVGDSIVTFVDPDSSGDWIKVCRKVDAQGRCLSRGDSVLVLQAPPGPHDGFPIYYSITYEARNAGDRLDEDAFVPDTSNAFAACDTTGMGMVQAGLDPSGAILMHIRNSCRNLNDKLNNLVGPVEPTGGPTKNLEAVGVVPNPYRGTAPWDLPGSHEIHFINLPKTATVKIYTVAGDLVRELHHDDAIRDYEIWDLKSGSGRDVSSGIYMYRVESGTFTFQNRFIVIR